MLSRTEWPNYMLASPAMSHSALTVHFLHESYSDSLNVNLCAEYWVQPRDLVKAYSTLSKLLIPTPTTMVTQDTGGWLQNSAELTEREYSR